MAKADREVVEGDFNGLRRQMEDLKDRLRNQQTEAGEWREQLEDSGVMVNDLRLLIEEKDQELGAFLNGSENSANT